MRSAGRGFSLPGGTGAVIAIPGAVDMGLSFLFVQDTERGIVLMILGAGLSALGWLVTLGVRFSKKLPKPASDIPRVEQALRINPGAIKGSVVVSLLIVAALILFMPAGKSPELLPIVGLVAAALMSITGGMAYSASILKNSAELYARWLPPRWGGGKRRVQGQTIEREGLGPFADCTYEHQMP
jgi:hypothetical protein